MEDLKYVECQNCGTIHYVISEAKAKTLSESNTLYDEFSNRNLECCVKCGLKNRFLNVSEDYASEYLHDTKVPPILLRNDESKRIATEGAAALP